MLGVLMGGLFPQDQYPHAYDFFHFLSKAFIQLIKGLIVPLLISTIIVGIAQTGDLKSVGRMGGKALLYFEIVTTLALVIGMVILMFLTFMLTSKGVAGVPRATLVIIAGTCHSFGLPGEAGVAMLLAVDEVMDMARTMTNVIGNGLASVVVARWEGVVGTGPTSEVD